MPGSSQNFTGGDNPGCGCLYQPAAYAGAIACGEHIFHLRFQAGAELEPAGVELYLNAVEQGMV